jgi:hypothetical protein
LHELKAGRAARRRGDGLQEATQRGRCAHVVCAVGAEHEELVEAERRLHGTQRLHLTADADEEQPTDRRVRADFVEQA